MFKIDSRVLILLSSICFLAGCSAAPDSWTPGESITRADDESAASADENSSNFPNSENDPTNEPSAVNQQAPVAECHTQTSVRYYGWAQCLASTPGRPSRWVSQNISDYYSPVIHINDPFDWTIGCDAFLPSSYLACKPSPIIGNIDGITTLPDGRVEVGGWACEQGAKGITSSVHVYVGGPAGGGTMITSGIANLSAEPAVGVQCGDASIGHRFKIDLTPWKQSSEGAAVYVHGISQSGGTNLLLANSGGYRLPVVAPSCSLSSPQNGANVPKGQSVTFSLRSAGMPPRLIVLWIGTDNGVPIAPQLVSAANGDFSYVNTNTTQITYVRRAEFRNANSGTVVCTTNPVTTTFLP